MINPLPKSHASGLQESAGLSVHSERVFTWWDYPMFFLLSSLTFAAVVYFLNYWLTLEDWHSHPIILGMMTVMLAVVLVNNQGRWYLLAWMRRPKPMPARDGWKVAVVTTFVDGGEPLTMLEETVRALVALDYPHDTWVLDEADDARVQDLCRRLGAHHFSRHRLPQYQTQRGLFQSRSKHGNYNAWLYEIGFHRYNIIAAFDPDHIPSAGFLLQTLGYFEDLTVGYVQAAQVYYNQQDSFIARGAAEETYAYYSSVQMASYGLGYPVVIGCHSTHRMAALQSVGGFAPHDADDLLITLLYRARRWQGIYIPHTLAKGLTPVDWAGYLGQQRRWARSVLDLKFRFYPRLSGRLPIKTRIMSLLHGLNYLHTSVLIPMGLLLVCYMLALGAVPNIFDGPMAFRVALLAVAVHLCEFYRQRFYVNRKTEWGWHWRVGLLHLAKWPYLLCALVEVMVDRRLPYAMTPKVRDGVVRRRMMWPQIVVIIVLLASWLGGLINGAEIPPVLHMAAGLLVAASLFLIFTERWRFPDPYTGNQKSTGLRRVSFIELLKKL